MNKTRRKELYALIRVLNRVRFNDNIDDCINTLDNIKYDESTAKVKGQNYSIPLKILINLRIEETGEIRQKDIYLGEIPLMTDRGTFIINGA